MLIVILYFMFSVYSTNDLVGSPSAMFELLQTAAVKRPVDGNLDGSYLTMKSNYALIFGVIQLCSGLGTVFLDQGYWQRAIASRPTTAVRAYIMGGLAWFAIPFGFATTLGLAAVALTDNPRYPTYPNPMTSSQVSAGLSAPFAAATLLGRNGAVALLLTLFMAVTSSSSSELIAVSSILTFDVYKTYIKPSATPEQLIFVSHVMICVFGVVMAVFACIWNAVGIDLGWLFLTMGLLIGGAVFPAAFSITWKGQTRLGALCGALGGLVAGPTAWLVEAKVHYGEVNITTTGGSYPTLAGNMAAVMTGLILSVAISYIKPDNTFEWDVTRAINAPAAGQSVAIVRTDGKNDDQTNDLATFQAGEKEMLEDAAVIEDAKKLKNAFIVAVVTSLVLSFIMDFLIPIPMFLSHYIFSKSFFTAWVIISFIWVFGAMALCGILPILETRRFFKHMFLQLLGLGQKSPAQ
jgi:Na+/proline symporter